MLLIGRELEGIWHTSIVVFAHEFYFDGGVGIIREARPGHTRFGAPYRTEHLGDTERSESEFLLWVRQQSRDDSNFGPNGYDLLRNNCNHFTQAASQFLLGRDIPSVVRDMIPMLLNTPLGRMLRPLLDRSTSHHEMNSVTGGSDGAFAPSAVSSSASRTGTTPDYSMPSTSDQQSTVEGLLNPRSSFTEGEEEDLMLARVMLESNELLGDNTNEEGVRITVQGLELLQRILQNIINNPRNASYRSFSTKSETYVTKLKPIEHFGVSNLLSLVGFRFQTQDVDTNIGRWILSDADGSQALLRRVVDVIDDIIENVNYNAAIAMSSRDQTEPRT
ncbi:unnamed protein product [Phytomonas sp. EM1]|nr:unnamed protein product [Phytomonas sp. EM1]|eukprot:CCW60889.1 unnamed protein product [Phytomonas sp. isolate EM1]